jgi:hypothetical protein
MVNRICFNLIKSTSVYVASQYTYQGVATPPRKTFYLNSKLPASLISHCEEAPKALPKMTTYIEGSHHQIKTMLYLELP